VSVSSTGVTAPLLRAHVAAGLLKVAARVFAEQGERASMTAIAEAAGVGRATLYRYFPTKDALVAALHDTAFTHLTRQVAAAGLDAVPVPEALARLTRIVIATASEYRALALFDKTAAQAAEADHAMHEPFRQLFHRAAAEGVLRADIPVDGVYLALLEGMIGQVISGRIGVEQASAAATAVFLDGARTPAAARQR